MTEKELASSLRDVFFRFGSSHAFQRHITWEFLGFRGWVSGIAPSLVYKINQRRHDSASHSRMIDAMERDCLSMLDLTGCLDAGMP